MSLPAPMHTDLNFHTWKHFLKNILKLRFGMKAYGLLPRQLVFVPWNSLCLQTPVHLVHCVHKQTVLQRGYQQNWTLSTFLSRSLLYLALWLERLNEMNFIYLAMLPLASGWVWPGKRLEGQRCFFSAVLLAGLEAISDSIPTTTQLLSEALSYCLRSLKIAFSSSERILALSSSGDVTVTT